MGIDHFWEVEGKVNYHRHFIFLLGVAFETIFLDITLFQKLEIEIVFLENCFRNFERNFNGNEGERRAVSSSSNFTPMRKLTMSSKCNEWRHIYKNLYFPQNESLTILSMVYTNPHNCDDHAKSKIQTIKMVEFLPKFWNETDWDNGSYWGSEGVSKKSMRC